MSDPVGRDGTRDEFHRQGEEEDEFEWEDALYEADGKDPIQESFVEKASDVDARGLEIAGQSTLEMKDTGSIQAFKDVDKIPRGHESRIHKSHFLLLLHRGLLLDRITCGKDPKYQDIELALEKKLRSFDSVANLNLSCAGFNARAWTRGGEGYNVCTKIAQWVVRTFHRSTEATVHALPKKLHLHHQMMQAIQHGTDKEEFLVHIFVAGCRMSHARARTVQRLLPAMNESRHARKTPKGSSLERKEKDSMPWHVDRSIWAEVWNEGLSKWDSVDVLAEFRNQASSSQQPSTMALSTSKAPTSVKMGYIFAFENGTVRDVGWKYNKSNHATSPSRKDGRLASHLWIMRSIRSLLPRHEEEDDIAGKASQPIPKSLTGLKNHPYYVLECHLGKYEGVKPRSRVLGLCKGMPVYSTDDVAQLHTESRWVREGRIVREEERSQPYKVVRKQNGNSKPEGTMQITDSMDDLEDDDSPKSLLFGIWQTAPYSPGRVSNSGKIPANRYGCIEVYGSFSLPEGTQHVNAPRASIIARKLGLEYVPAMVGWERRKGQNVPKFEGIVVLQEQAHLLLHAIEADAELRAQAEFEKRESRARDGWHTLLSTLWTRQRLENNDTIAQSGGSHYLHKEDIEYL